MGNGTLAKFGLENSLVFKADLRSEKYELFPSKNFSFSRTFQSTTTEKVHCVLGNF